MTEITEFPLTRRERGTMLEQFGGLLTELSRRREQFIEQRGTNSRRQADEAAAVDGIEARARAEREWHCADAAAHKVRALGEARAASEAARVTSY